MSTINGVNQHCELRVAPYDTKSVTKKDYYTANEGVPEFPKDIPLYPLAKFGGYSSKKGVFSDSGAKYDLAYVESDRNKNLNGDEILTFYRKSLKKQGWEEKAVAGELHCFMAFFAKESRTCTVKYSKIKDDNNPNSPYNPDGAKIQIWEKNNTRIPVDDNIMFHL